MRNDGHAGYTAYVAGRSSETEVVGVPEKGRNAGIALRNELGGEETNEILDILNGRGKTASKTGEGFSEVWNEVQNYEFLEFKDLERDFPRPVLTNLETSNKKITGYSNSPIEKGFDRFYQGFDKLVEENYPSEEISRDFEDLTREIAEDKGYSLERKFGRAVKWSPMNTNLENTPEKILIPEDFTNVGEAITESYWDEVPELETFASYASENGLTSLTEEELLTETSEDIAGIYMYVSGNTAEKQGLDYEDPASFNSQLGCFKVSDQ